MVGTYPSPLVQVAVGRMGTLFCFWTLKKTVVVGNQPPYCIKLLRDKTGVLYRFGVTLSIVGRTDVFPIILELTHYRILLKYRAFLRETMQYRAVQKDESASGCRSEC